MDSADQWEPSFPREEGSLEEDSLLGEALAIIGDLDFGSVHSLEPSTLPTPIDVPGSFPSSAVEAAVSSVSQQQQWPQLASPALLTTENRPRRRRRVELLYLRGAVAELESQLARLRGATDRQCTKQEHRSRNDSKEIAAQLWETVALHQRAKREEAEIENAALKRRLQDEIQVGKRLERLLLRKRPSVEALESSDPEAKRVNRGQLRSWNRTQIFDELVDLCTALYADTEGVLSRFAGGVRVGIPRTVELVYDFEYGVSVHSTEQRIFPFSYEETASELWVMFPQVSPPPRIHHREDAKHDSDTTELQFDMVLRAGQSRAVVSVKLAKRRFVEPQRVVIVYSGLVEPSEDFAANMEGIRIHHKGWQITEPLERSPSRGSRITSYHASVPVGGETYKVGTLMEFIRSAISVELEAHNLKLENRLIERRLNGAQRSI